jgi:hypothetical protein
MGEVVDKNLTALWGNPRKFGRIQCFKSLKYFFNKSVLSLKKQLKFIQ